MNVIIEDCVYPTNLRGKLTATGVRGTDCTLMELLRQGCKEVVRIKVGNGASVGREPEQKVRYKFLSALSRALNAF